MGRLILIRHSKIKPLYPGAFVGSLDLGLCEEGIKAAREMEFELEGSFRLFCSPMKRATETAGILFQDYARQTDERLKEIDFGNWENRSFEQIQKENPEEVDLWVNSPMKFTFPGGENISAFTARVEAAAADLASAAQEETVVAVAHGGVIRFMLCHLIGLPYERHLSLRCDRPSVNVVDLYDGFATLSGLNLSGFSAERL